MPKLAFGTTLTFKWCQTKQCIKASHFESLPNPNHYFQHLTLP